MAERQLLEAALDYVREGDGFNVTKLDRLAMSVGDLLASYRCPAINADLPPADQLRIA